MLPGEPLTGTRFLQTQDGLYRRYERLRNHVASRQTNNNTYQILTYIAVPVEQQILLSCALLSTPSRHSILDTNAFGRKYKLN